MPKPHKTKHQSQQKESWKNPIDFPEQLPVCARREEIAEAIKEHQVLILAGETGSGKTTQLPKICLSLGYGTKGLIGHTQPRRIAARTVADRIASELKTQLGTTVGYQVRFNDISSTETRIKLMTDGVLLAEFQRDRNLSRYEVIIIDEAHERSLNIDFLLGLLKPLCQRRPDLKIIITSATIDLDKFSKHFSIKGKAAPIIEVSGRTFPVETLYQPPEDGNAALPDLITLTVDQIIRNEAKGLYRANGDILIFCAGEREIRDAAQALKRAQLPIEVLPLYSRLSIAEQNKIFRPTHRRKVVLATNVAETSITVPGIAYVIDPGLARISRYSFRSKVQRLPIEAISQASANQRKGRCGRVANGVCIRLYSEEDFIARPEFTSAEILRSNLASVILKMLRFKIKDIQRFDFIDHPDNRLLNDGYKLLQELNAIDQHRNLTSTGRKMSDLPIDPRYARILVAAEQENCLQDALVLISALSIQDPRERPADKQQAADTMHQRIAHPQSDFSSYLNLWQSIQNARDTLSNTKFKQHCIEHYWSISRVFEWRELYRQLKGQCTQLGLKPKEWQKIELPKVEANIKNKKLVSFDKRYESLHIALLSGLLSNIANKDIEGLYTATRSRTIHLFPGSAQAKRKPKWLVSAEFLETSKLYAHTIGDIRPEWLIKVASHLCKYSYSDPHYQTRAGTVRANRKTLLYGLMLKDKEAVNFGPIKPVESRAIFIQEALVGARYQPSKPNTFFDHNQRLIRDIEKVETKTRRRNLLVDEKSMYDFYAERIPEHIYSKSNFEKWLYSDEGNKTSSSHSQRLTLNKERLLANDIDTDEVAQFPDHITVLGKTIPVVYQFNPGQTADGITMIIPISVLSPFPTHIGDWLVPGLLREKCIALIKTLPKAVRRNFAPAADAIDRVLGHIQASNEPLHKVLGEALFKSRGIKVTADMFDLSKLDDFYKMNYRVMDVDGSLIDEERNLSTLKKHYADAVQESVHADQAPERAKFEKHNITTWNFGDIQNSISYLHQGMTVTAYPMLKENDDGSLSLLVSDQAEFAKYHTENAIMKLARLSLGSGSHRQSEKYLSKELFAIKKPKGGQLSNLASQLKSVNPKHSDKSEWLNEAINAGLKRACFDGTLHTIKSQSQFESSLNKGAKSWVSHTMEIETALISALRQRDGVLKQANEFKVNSLSADEAIEDIKAQLYQMFEPNFLRYTSLSELKQYQRYMRAIESRIDKINFSSKIANEATALAKFQSQFDQLTNKQPLGPAFSYTQKPELKDFATLLQEWRVSLYAQHLKTQIPVSQQRVEKAWNEIISS